MFTEHNLDTKEDQKAGEGDILVGSAAKLFKQPSNSKSLFQKFEGLIMKRQSSEYSSNYDQNVSEKSLIFCPFNSSQSNFDEDKPELFDWPESVKELLQPKKSKIVKFSMKCRDLNREYEENNNEDLDNGVYNAFVNE